MRISDWSSDVCSSDLRRGERVRPLAAQRGEKGKRIGDEGGFAGLAAMRDGGEEGGVGFDEQDRKSVVEGKRVSVRVDLGGRRSITKKNTNTSFNSNKGTVDININAEQRHIK